MGAIDGYEPLTKAELLATLRRERAELDGLIARAGGRLAEPGAAGDWTLRDLLAHLGAYERWQVLGLGGAARPLPGAPPDVDLGDVNQRNAWFHAADRERPAAAVLAEERAAYEEILRLVEARTQEDLQVVYTLGEGGRILPAAEVAGPAWPGWPLWRWIISNTYDHYRQHIPALRAWLDR
jgi:hypothetical protein